MTAANDKGNDLIIFAKWVDFLEWLMPALDKFPQKARFTFHHRIETIALDIVEDLVEARYTPEKRVILKRANLRLEKLRVLMRLSQRLRYLSNEGYRHATKSIDETGRMLGGWMKQQQK